MLTTAGMDSSLKFWDIRKMTSPVYSKFNNSHWVWDARYNQTYSRLLLTSSSSAMVKLLIFDKEEDDFYSSSVSSLYSCNEVEFIEFDEAVYSIDWAKSDQWVFGSVSFNGILHVNEVPEDLKYRIMID